jgi:hypothetical protein
MGAHGTVVEPDGSLRPNDASRPTVRTWLFPVEQAVLLDNWDPIGLRGPASESYTVDNLFVPEEFTITREDPTLRREAGPLYAFPQQTSIRSALPASASASPAACSTLSSILHCARPRGAAGGSRTMR